ncbi:hypothetical protein NDU88_004018 [Pleurodeles waltl]|uniref:Uncharacterized protein n=1 Tax=Pleurodeles waltl TaxID=8319 RepID=A0AAV7WUC5_PLEWA|nr:hypothetical protein NDU88_004018 [Pleurodeles waltl]
MSERGDRHATRLDGAERRISEAEDKSADSAERNAENPKDAGPFEGPEAVEEGTPPRPPQREKKSTDEMTEMQEKEIGPPEPTLGGDTQETAER